MKESNQATDPQLKPCPFCGDDVVNLIRDQNTPEQYYVACGCCGVVAPPERKWLAIAHWNSREKPDTDCDYFTAPVATAESHDIPWSKLAAPCSCGSRRFEMFKFDGVRSRACCACGLISHYLEKFLVSPKPGHLTREEAVLVQRTAFNQFSGK